MARNERIFRCVICGITINAVVDEAAATWQQEFRTVYSCSGEPGITGVGLHLRATLGAYTAPIDPNETWRTTEVGDMIMTVPVMSQAPEEETHGYPIHDSCWKLLLRYVAPQELDIGRLHEICAAVPYSSHCQGLTWDHCYAGLIRIDDETAFPWEEKYQIVPRGIVPKTPAQRYTYADPWEVDLEPLTEVVISPPPQGPTEHSRLADCFAQLPFELREMIAVLLSTQEMFNLRQAARSFLPILESKRFWQSRFWSGNNRGFFFEMMGCRNKFDLRALWKATVHRRKDILFNSDRVWNILGTIVPLLDMHITRPDFNPPAPYSSFGVSADTSQKLSSTFSRGCNRTDARSIVWPENIVRLAVSLVDTGGAKYISGLHFTLKNVTSICVRYISSTKQACAIDSAITGFLVAAGSRGLHALRVLTKSCGTSAWLGDPTDVPITRRLANVGPLQQLCLEFDVRCLLSRAPNTFADESDQGFKIVSIQLGTGQGLSATENRTCFPDLREVAMWHPNIPPPRLHLLHRKPHWPLAFRPVHWTRFGGPEGKHLKQLTAISVARNGGINYIEFEFCGAISESPLHILGRRADKITDHWESFEINGKAGERIQSISVSFGSRLDSADIQDERNHVLLAMKVQTSWGNEHVFKPEDPDPFEEEDNKPVIDFQKLPMVPNTVITGLYATQNPEDGLTDLGLMTEVLPESIESR